MIKYYWLSEKPFAERSVNYTINSHSGVLYLYDGVFKKLMADGTWRNTYNPMLFHCVGDDDINIERLEEEQVTEFITMLELSR